jgi:hypothetical protein
MSETTETPEQAIAATETPTVIETTPAAPVETLEQAIARNAPVTEIMELQAQALAPKPAPVKEVKAEETAKTDPDLKPADELPQDDPEDEVKAANRPRLTHLSDKDKLTANAIIMLTRTGLSYEDASRRVLGESITTAAEIPGVQQEPEIAPEIVALTTTVTEGEARLTEIEARFAEIESEAAPDVFIDEIAKLSAEQARLLNKVTMAGNKLAATELKAEQAALRQERDAEKSQAVNAQANKQYAEVGKSWPDLLTPGTDQYDMVVLRAERAQKDATHPLHALALAAEYDMESYGKFLSALAEETGKALHLTAKSPNAAPAAIAPKQQAKPAVAQPGLASGSLGSTPAAPQQSQAQIAQKAIEEWQASRSAGGSNQRAMRV